MRMKTDVTLNGNEKSIARFIAEGRTNYNRGHGVVDKNISDKKKVIELEGMAGEMAFSKLANLYPDFDTNGARAYDVILDDGTRVDVKTSSYISDPHLKRLKEDDIKYVDVYVLMAGKLPNYKYIGWATFNELIQEKNLHDYGHGLTYKLEPHELHHTDISEIKAEED